MSERDDLFIEICWLVRKKGAKTLAYYDQDLIGWRQDKDGIEDFWTEVQEAGKYSTQEEAEQAARDIPEKQHQGFHLETVQVLITIQEIRACQRRER